MVRPARSGLRRRYAATHGPVAQRIERRTSNPCAEVRLLPGPLRGKVRPAARAMMTFPRSDFDPLRTWPRRAKPAAPADESVQGSGSAAAGTNPLCDRFGMRALSTRVCLLACPARSQPHRPVSAWTFLRFECLLFRVRQVRNILGKPPSPQTTMSFRRDLLAFEVMAGSLATVLICDDEPSLRELIRVSFFCLCEPVRADEPQPDKRAKGRVA